ncbi:hypothetical protein BJ165DRAFT_414551 [Panaeolus papilionaceus]|nr:hypothetical protein BJ165DRAFT_414551 [Panaeolus papilionaceus]
MPINNYSLALSFLFFFFSFLRRHVSQPGIFLLSFTEIHYPSLPLTIRVITSLYPFHSLDTNTHLPTEIRGTRKIGNKTGRKEGSVSFFRNRKAKGNKEGQDRTGEVR